MDTTAYDLKLLSIGYFIQGGIVISSGLMGIGYLAFMGAVLTPVLNGRAQPRSDVPPALLFIFAAAFLVIMLLTLAFGPA